MFGGIKKLIIWHYIVEYTARALFHAGVFGSGKDALDRKKLFVKKFGKEKENILDPMMEALKESEETGTPVTKRPDFWALIINIVSILVVTLTDILPKDSKWMAILLGIGGSLVYIKDYMGIRKLEIVERTSYNRAIIHLNQIRAASNHTIKEWGK